MEMDALRKGFRDDGVVVLRGALDDAALADALAAYEWSLAHPGPGASRIRQHGDALFYQDLYNPGCTQAYRAMLERSPLTRIVADIWQTPDVWFMYEQVFLKEGGESRRTPWHQDSSYLAVDGADLAVAWISFDAVAQQDSLEFVRGSHRGVLYNGSSFALDDDTAPLHGGAPTHPGGRRRTLTLRYFGRDCRYDARPGPAGPRLSANHGLKHGDPLRDPGVLEAGVAALHNRLRQRNGLQSKNGDISGGHLFVCAI